MTTDTTFEAAIPSLLRDPDLLLPLRVDVTSQGARFVDSLCMRADASAYDVWEMAWQTCVDSNLPPAFHWRMYLQLHEQIVAYRELIAAFMEVLDLPLPSYPPLAQPQQIAMAFRSGSVEYSEKVLWDLQAQSLSPEIFARTTCSDLGLPPAMEPAIAFRLREAVIRTFLSWFESAVAGSSAVAPTGSSGLTPTSTSAPANITSMETDDGAAATQSESDTPVQTTATGFLTMPSGGSPTQPSSARIALLPPAAAAEMIAGLWRRARPTMGAAEEQMTIAHARLPRRNESNAFVYTSSSSGQQSGKSAPSS